jgi:hypothetical protein
MLYLQMSKCQSRLGDVHPFRAWRALYMWFVSGSRQCMPIPWSCALTIFSFCASFFSSSSRLVIICLLRYVNTGTRLVLESRRCEYLLLYEPWHVQLILLSGFEHVLMTHPERPKQSHTTESGRGRKRRKDCEILQAHLSQHLLSRVRFLLYAPEGCIANRSARSLTTIEQLPQHYDVFVLSLLSFSQHNVSASTSPRRL